jgi:hypothetical protein
VLRFTACDCGARGLVRVERSFWMRLVFTRRHYYCPSCRANLLLSRRAVLAALAAPPAPRELPLPTAMEPITHLPGESSLAPDATVPARYVQPHQAARQEIDVRTRT